MNISISFPPEWEEQSAIQIAWPHKGTDWADMLEEVMDSFILIAHEIAKRENLIIVTPYAEAVRLQLGCTDGYRKIIICEIPTNDTWARDHAGISVLADGIPTVYDFRFNGWGMKFAANEDNLITKRMFESKVYVPQLRILRRQGFVLEGGSIETDGNGTILTTSKCLLSDNRNENLSKEQIEQILIQSFGVRKVLWLNAGHLKGDDTDGHIDTLARFCNRNTIAYIKCKKEDCNEHFDELQKMENELAAMTNADGEPYNLVPLPMADPVYLNGERLPATYANFLIINGAVLVPVYDSYKDEIAMETLKDVFPDREIVGINCLPLLKQHGSLHCVTMQYPKGFIE